MTRTSVLLEAPPTRIAGLGIGTFLLIAFGGLLIALCYLGTILKTSAKFYFRLCFAYLILWIFFLTAKRKSRWIDTNMDGHGSVRHHFHAFFFVYRRLGKTSSLFFDF